MKANRISRSLVGSFLLLLAICLPVFATTLFDTGNVTITSGDPSQLGRLVRAVHDPSDWSSTTWASNTTFPGSNNPGVSFHYHTFTIPASDFNTTPFIQITTDDPTAKVFVSAYLDNYNPTSFSINYLGDEGFSGNFPGDTGFFQLHMPTGHNLILVVNDAVGSGGGVGVPYRLLVEGFTDTLYTSSAGATPAISVAVLPSSVKEGKDATFTFTASPASHAAVTVNYTMSGQATNGSDYTLSGTPGKVTIGVSQATATVVLHSIVDNLNEGSESAILTVTSGTGYTVGSPKTASLIIKDKN